MARVIKGGQGGQSPRRSANLGVSADRKVIEKEVYKARQEAAAILAKAEEERAEILAEGQKTANQAREEAATDGAEEAFAEAAVEALSAFRHRAERFGEARDDIQVLALEVAQKILGGNLKMKTRDVDGVVAAGMRELRGRRKLRVQVPESRVAALRRERPLLMGALENEPDLVIEATDDVSPGFARVVTEVGGALCGEQAALDALAESVDVEETAVAPEKQSAIHAITNASERQDGLDSLRSEPSDVLSEGGFDEPSLDLKIDDLYVGDDYDDSDESTAFIPDVHRRAKVPDSAAEAMSRLVSQERSSEATHVAERPRRASERRKKRSSSASKSRKSSRRARDDAEATQALDVSDLRRDLTAESAVDDDLDLFADDAVE